MARKVTVPPDAVIEHERDAGVEKPATIPFRMWCRHWLFQDQRWFSAEWEGTAEELHAKVSPTTKAGDELVFSDDLVKNLLDSSRAARFPDAVKIYFTPFHMAVSRAPRVEEKPAPTPAKPAS